MAKPVRMSLATKCQLLFGVAVLLVLTAALSVVWLRMQALVNAERNLERLADTWIQGHVDLPAGWRESARLEPLGEEQQLSLMLIEPEAFEASAERDAFLAPLILELEEPNCRPAARFGRTGGQTVSPFYRYAMPIHASQMLQRQAHQQGREVDLQEELRARAAEAIEQGEAGQAADEADGEQVEAATPDPVEAILLIHMRDPSILAQRMVNRIYIITAGVLAGLLALAAFWFITSRVILSPVRLLRDVTTKVSGGDLNIRADINTGDEFQELSDVLNTMLENLKEKQDQLRSINKSLDLKLGELAASNVTLYEANKIKGEFLANVSHELRTPLNSMIGFAEVLHETLADSDDPVDEKRRRYVDNIVKSSRRLLELINDLLDLAKIEAGRMELRVDAVSVHDTVEGLLNLIRPQADKKHIALQTRIASDLPAIRSDAGKLQQVLFNFLSNAVKFTPEAGSVTLSVTPLPDQRGRYETGSVRFSVTDTGPGIAADQQERVFEKFTQLQPGETREHGGTGLGLTISRELAGILQGRIDLDSELGHGATFSLTIPVRLERRSVPLMPDLAEPGGRW